MNSNNYIKIDYYKGSYGPTIRIETHHIDELIQIHSVFYKLKLGLINMFSFKQMKNVIISGIEDLIIEEAANKTNKKIGKNENNSNLVIIWSLTKDECEHCEGLVEGLIQCKSSGHQYLVEDYNIKESIIIELAYNEIR